MGWGVGVREFSLLELTLGRGHCKEPLGEVFTVPVQMASKEDLWCELHLKDVAGEKGC